MNIKTEPTDVEVNSGPDRSSSTSSAERGDSPVSSNAKDNLTSFINDTELKSSVAERVDSPCQPRLTAARNSPLTDLLDDCSKHRHHFDHVVDTPSTQTTIKLEAALPSISVPCSSLSQPSVIGHYNVSSNLRSVEDAEVASQVCVNAVVVDDTRLSPVPVASTTARNMLSATESSISKLESFVASLNQHNRRNSCGINLIPDHSAAASAALWTGSVGFHHIAKAPGGDNDRRIPLSSSPMAATLAAGVVEARVAPALSATCYRPPASMFATKSHRSECSNGVENVSRTFGRREEPLDLSVKKTDMNEVQRTYVESSSSNGLHRASETIINGSTAGRMERLERRQHISVSRHGRVEPTAVASAANSLACLERDFGENSALLNRIGSLNQLRHVHHGLAEFVTQQNARSCHQSYNDKHQQHTMAQSYQQQYHQSQVNSIGLRTHQPHRQSGVENEHFTANDLRSLERSSGVIVTPQSSPVGVTTNGTRPSMIGQLLSINVHNATDQPTWSNGRMPLHGDRDNKLANSRDSRNRRKPHHQQHHSLQKPRRTASNGETQPLPSANLTATGIALKCLECNGRFSSLPELTLHMIQAGHYANIVCTEDGSHGNRGYGNDVVRSAFTGWDVGKGDAVKRVSSTRWRQETDLKTCGPASPPLSMDDDESISSTSIPDSGSASMSPIKSPALSTSSSSPSRRDDRTDAGKLLVSDLLKRVDPLVARNLMINQPNNLFDVSMNGGSSATAAVAAFGMVIKSMKKYIECSLNQSAVDVDCKSNVTTKTQRRLLRPHHCQKGEAMTLDGQSTKYDRENPIQNHRKNSSPSSISDSFDASERARKSCDVTAVSRKRGSVNHIVDVPDKRFAVLGKNELPLESRRLFDIETRESGSDSRNKLMNTTTTSTQSVSLKRQPSPLVVATGPSEVPVSPCRSSLQDLDASCSSSEHRPNMTSQAPTASLTDVVAIGNNMVVARSQFMGIEDIRVPSSPSLPQQSAETTSPINCSDPGPSDVNEYAMRFGKYCRLARELAGRAN